MTPRPFATFSLADPGETEALGRALAPRLKAGDVVALEGPLGVGKTCLARAVIHALPGPPGSDSEPVPSPTFTLVQIYERRPAPVWHFDLYRIEREEEIWELGWEEALAEAIVLVEWPERLGSLLPDSALRLSLVPFDETDGGGRRADLAGSSDWEERLAGLAVDAD